MITQEETAAVVAAKRGVLLDIGCGASKQPGGFVGMDHQALDGVDVVHSWNDFPWPFEDESVLTIVASHVVEHVNPADGHFLRWMDECWRILKPEGQLALVTPYAGSPGYWMDPTHCNPCTEATWFYFDPEHGTDLHRFYRPLPWKIEMNTWHETGNLELVLRRRPRLLDVHPGSGPIPDGVRVVVGEVIDINERERFRVEQIADGQMHGTFFEYAVKA